MSVPQCLGPQIESPCFLGAADIELEYCCYVRMVRLHEATSGLSMTSAHM
jgi:hypothetical protein